MAVRLSVIMVHSRSPSASAERMAEAIVGALIGIHGVDLTVVGPIADLNESSTDRLTLSAMSGDVAVLDWLCPEETLAALQSVGFDGVRSAHANDADALTPPLGQRRIYAFDLNRFSDADAVVAALADLQKVRQTKTFSIGVPAASLPVAANSVRAEVDSNTAAVPQQFDQQRSATDGPGVNGSPSKPKQDKPRSIDLDELLDELDQLDP